MDNDAIILTSKQNKLLLFITATGDSMLINGFAGSGKAVLIRELASRLFLKGRIYTVCAFTGIAAENINGSTFHSQFVLKNGILDIDKDIEPEDERRTGAYDLIRNLDVLIIDEVSMVRSDMLCKLNQMFQKLRGSELPFGGVQLLMFGDLMQLPPVALNKLQENQSLSDFELLTNKYGTVKGFLTEPVKCLPHDYLDIDEHFRQTDPEQLELLDRVRTGNIDQKCVDRINEYVSKPLPNPFKGIYITSTNYDADKINNYHLKQLDPATERVYHVEPEYRPFMKDYNLDEELVLRVGAKIIMIKNGAYWRNGTMGVVTDLLENEIKVEIDGRIIPVFREKFMQTISYVKDGKLEQQNTKPVMTFPLKLAYAITTHKSQGQTYHGDVFIKMTDTPFLPGLLYVALSRATDLNNVYTDRPFTLEDFKTDGETLRYMREQAKDEEDLGFLAPAIDRMELFYNLIEHIRTCQMLKLRSSILVRGSGASLLAAIMEKRFRNRFRIMYQEENPDFSNAAEKYCQKYFLTNVEKYDPVWCDDDKFDILIEMDTLGKMHITEDGADEKACILEMKELLVENGSIVLVNSDRISDYESRYIRFVKTAIKMEFTRPKFCTKTETTIDSLRNNYSISVMNRIQTTDLSMDSDGIFSELVI